ncbi:hypothetical protein [Martelella mediterranea]|uniref:Uncharacterized protein n=1 Tax=Martelella mediterranea TaxID=293089 RepID=A0A4R3NS07_9HYPH|nr:hypothetical protein [Martelella mediterranea]TCT39576.1 hypothetical protein EDC90_101274 [Martelella mediterranea]
MKNAIAATAIAAALAAPAMAHDMDHAGGIHAETSDAVPAQFDIVNARVTTEKNTAVFHIGVSGRAGESKPAPSGQLAGSEVFAYVWPTNIDPYEVGFERGTGILALAVTAHPDFDDTPLFDENGDGNPGNDGDLWHSHWVVLGPDDACGPGALKVIDIPEGASPRLPKTWPGLPILIDSPGWDPLIHEGIVAVRVPFDDIGVVEAASYDGVTVGLRVNESIHAPLLCVADVFDVASGDLSLPGKVNE